MSRSRFYTLLFIVLPLTYYFSLPVSLGDLAIWVAQGRYMLAHRTLLDKDVFSVLPTYELIYSVLSSIFYGALDWLGGLNLVIVFHKICLAATLLQILLYFKKHQQLQWTTLQIVMSIFCLAGASLSFIDRQMMLVMPLFLTAFILIEDEPLDDFKNFWGLWIIFVIWLNCHGSWAVFLLMYGWKLGVSLLQQRFQLRSLKKPILFFATFIISSLLNPFGYKIWPYLFMTANISRQRQIEEWAATTVTVLPPMGAMYYLLSAAIVGYIIKKYKTFSADLWASPFWILWLFGFTGIRHVPFVFLTTLIVFSKYAGFKGVVDEKTSQASRVVNLSVSGLLVVLMLLMTPYFKPVISEFLPEGKKSIYDKIEPLAATEVIKKTGLTGPIFNEWCYGSYLAYAVPNKILLDTRNIIFRDEDLNEIAQIIFGKTDNWQKFLEKYGFQFIMLEKKEHPEFIKQIKSSGMWDLIFDNDEQILFQKK